MKGTFQVFLENVDLTCSISIGGQNFTAREMDVICCLQHGRAVKTIASYLSISSKTAENHIGNIMKKLQCHSQEAIRDHIEKSDILPFIRQHYNKIQIRHEFEKILTYLAKSNRDAFRKCFVTYEKASKEDLLFLKQLEKHLELAGIKVSVNRINNISPNNRYSFIEDSNAIIHIGSNECETNKINENIEFLNQKKFIIYFNDSYIYINSKKNHYIDSYLYKSYFNLFFDILRLICPSCYPEDMVSSFMLNHKRLFSETEEIIIQTSAQKETTKYKNKYTKITNTRFYYLFVLIAILIFFSWSIFSNINNRIQKYGHHEHSITSWNLPFPNLYFTGRKEEMRNITERFRKGNKISQPLNIVICTGLGGVGKTEIAKNFIHKSFMEGRQDYKLKFWFGAEKPEQLLESYSLLGQKLGITNKNSAPEEIINTIRNWFEARHNWIIVYDNAENLDTLTSFMPHKGGDILVTSRFQNWPNSIEIKPMNEEDAVNLVKNILNNHTNAQDIKRLTRRLKYLPLSLSQAGAYIKRNALSINDYMEVYNKEESKILKYNGNLPGLYHESPSITWNISIDKIKDESIAAYELLNCLAYLYPDNINRNYICNLLPEIKSRVDFDKIIGILLNYSLISYNDLNNTLSLHRLVQTVMCYRQLAENTREKWLARVIGVLVRDKDDHLILGGIAAREESIQYIINYYEQMAEIQKTSFVYHSLGCCYLVQNNFKKAGICFQKAIQKKANSSVYYEYGQALYLNNNIQEAIKQLKLSILAADDGMYSYFSEMEKNTVIDEYRQQIDVMGTVRIKSSISAYYLILKCFLETKNTREFLVYLREFEKLSRINDDILLKKLYSNILIQAKNEGVLAGRGIQ